MGGFTMTARGFVACYGIPYAFTFLNWNLYFTITSCIVLMMTLGLITIASVLSGPLEKLLLFCLMYFTRFYKFYQVVKKSMYGHEQRNAKTLLLFTTSVVFVVFSGCSTNFVVNGV